MGTWCSVIFVKGKTEIHICNLWFSGVHSPSVLFRAMDYIWRLRRQTNGSSSLFQVFATIWAESGSLRPTSSLSPDDDLFVRNRRSRDSRDRDVSGVWLNNSRCKSFRPEKKLVCGAYWKSRYRGKLSCDLAFWAVLGEGVNWSGFRVVKNTRSHRVSSWLAALLTPDWRPCVLKSDTSRTTDPDHSASSVLLVRFLILGWFTSTAATTYEKRTKEELDDLFSPQPPTYVSFSFCLLRRVTRVRSVCMTHIS
jgi:hypothetical protein